MLSDQKLFTPKDLGRRCLKPRVRAFLGLVLFLLGSGLVLDGLAQSPDSQVLLETMHTNSIVVENNR